MHHAVGGHTAGAYAHEGTACATAAPQRLIDSLAGGGLLWAEWRVRGDERERVGQALRSPTLTRDTAGIE
ncbi:hypothetical protein GCM10019017_09650 [Streptomyces showdoensis]